MQCPKTHTKRRVVAIFLFPPSLRLYFFVWGSSYRSLIIVWCARVKMPAIYSHYGGRGSLEPRTAIEGSFLAWGVSENWIAGSAAARLFFLTAIGIAIATRPFKFHENSVSYTSSSFVSSIHSFARNILTWGKFPVMKHPNLRYVTSQETPTPEVSSQSKNTLTQGRFPV